MSDVNFHTDKPLNLSIGTGDFTIECWYKSDYNTVSDCLFELSQVVGGMTSNYPNYVILSGEWCAYVGGQQRYLFPINKWSHLALVRYNGYQTYYVDGVAKLHFPHNTDMTGYEYLCIGNGYLYSFYIRGVIDSFRVANHAIYTKEFIPRSLTDNKWIYITEDKKVYRMT